MTHDYKRMRRDIEAIADMLQCLGVPVSYDPWPGWGGLKINPPWPSGEGRGWWDVLYQLDQDGQYVLTAWVSHDKSPRNGGAWYGTPFRHPCCIPIRGTIWKALLLIAERFGTPRPRKGPPPPMPKVSYTNDGNPDWIARQS